VIVSRGGWSCFVSVDWNSFSPTLRLVFENLRGGGGPARMQSRWLWPDPEVGEVEEGHVSKNGDMPSTRAWGLCIGVFHVFFTVSEWACDVPFDFYFSRIFSVASDDPNCRTSEIILTVLLFSCALKD